MTKEEIRSYTGNDLDYLIGHVSGLEKNKYYAIFDRKNMESLQLEQKIKKLNLGQKSLLKLGRILKLDFNDNKLYFMKGVNEWI